MISQVKCYCWKICRGNIPSYRRRNIFISPQLKTHKLVVTYLTLLVLKNYQWNVWNNFISFFDFPKSNYWTKFTYWNIRQMGSTNQLLLHSIYTKVVFDYYKDSRKKKCKTASLVCHDSCTSQFTTWRYFDQRWDVEWHFRHKL